MKLFTRYNQVNLTVMGILFVLSAVSYYYLINHILVHELDEELDNYKQKIEIFAGKTGNLPEKGALEDLEVTYSLVQEPSQTLQYKLTKQFDSGEHRMEKFRQLVYTQPVGSNYYKVIISKPLEGIRFLAKTIAYTTVAMLLTIIFTSLLLNYIVLRRLWRPFYNSMKMLKGFKLNEAKAADFPATQIDEFAFMNANLSSMMQSAQMEYRLLKEFTENASHEVQTPLAIIRSKLDLLIQEENLSEKQVNLLDSAYAAIKRISKLNQSLLLLAKIENHQYTEIKKINLRDEVKEKLEQLREFWQDNEIRISSDLRESFIDANPDLIDVLLNNLLGNAGMHNRKQGELNIQLTSDHLVISNTGSSKSLDSDRIFRRFYKEESHTQHNGLGLSIIKQICDQSGINIQYFFKDNYHVFILNWKNNQP